MAAVAVLAAPLVGGCVEDDTQPQSADACARVVDRAADAVEVDDQIDLLDTALVVCRSFDSLDAQLARYPSIIGYDTATFVANRCTTVEAPEVRTSTICSSAVSVDSTTVTTAPTPEIFYLGRTLDGREVRIVPDADTPFVEGNPEPIVRIVDIAAEDGCEGVQAELGRWAALAEDPIIGDEASVYAQHATNVLAYIGCVTPATEP